MFEDGLRAFAEELDRTRELCAQLLEGSPAGQESAARAFKDLVRPREALFRFSPMRTVMP